VAAYYEEEIEWLFRDEYDHHSIVLREADQPGCVYFTFKAAGYADDHLGCGRARERDLRAREHPSRVVPERARVIVSFRSQKAASLARRGHGEES
jgi:hypothetical protein